MASSPFPIHMWSFDSTLIRWVDQAAWLKAQMLFLAISNDGDPIASGVRYLIVRLRSLLGLPMEVAPIVSPEMNEQGCQ